MIIVLNVSKIPQYYLYMYKVVVKQEKPVASKSVSFGWKQVVDLAVSDNSSFSHLHYFLKYN